jgi:hypothetical protein
MLMIAEIGGLWMVLWNGKRWGGQYGTRADAEAELVHAQGALAKVRASRRDTDALCGAGYDPSE